MPPRGRVGFFCQSGALGVAILENVARRGLGLSTFVSAGNRADVSGNDLLQYWEEDDATEVVLLYLESIGNPRKFSRIARRVGREQAGRRGEVRADHAGRAGRPLGAAGTSGAAGGRRRDVPAGRRHPGRHARRDVRRRPAAGAPAAADGAAGRRGRQLRRARPAGCRLRRGASGWSSRSRSPWAPTPRREDFESRARRRDRQPRTSTRSSPCSSRRSNTTGEQVANVLATVGEQSDKPHRVDVPRQRGRAGAAARARPRGRRRPRARCRRTPRRSLRSARSPAWSSTRTGSTGRRARRRGSRTSTPAPPGCS